MLSAQSPSTADGTPSHNTKHRTACTNCNKKKIRCRFSDDHGNSCKSCLDLNIGCIPRSRKKRRPTVQHSGAESAQHPVSRNPVLPYQFWESGHGNQWSEADAHSGLAPLSENGAERHVPWQRQVSEITLQNLPQTSSGVAPSNAYPEGNWDNPMRSQTSITPQDPDSRQRPPVEIHTTHDTHPAQNASETATYIGRSHYLSKEVPIDEVQARTYPVSRDTALSEIDLKILEMKGCSIMPSRSARQSLIDTYMLRCYPFTPILDPQEVESSDTKQASLLLSQAVFLAGSRVSSAPGVTAFASSEQFYQRAKALFWSGHEKNPITVIKATIMLHWYNPDGPEHVSYDTSAFWLQLAVGLAHQVGLHKEPQPGPQAAIRRKLWWTLVARDSLIASGQGRPRAINPENSEIRPPCLEDFPGDRSQGELFISYVDICSLLGGLTESCSRKNLSTSQHLNLSNALYRWTRTLPDHLRLSQKAQGSDTCSLSPYNFHARQLHLPYFTTLTILSRSTTPTGTVSPVTILASSFVAGIFEDFLARDEQKFVGPIFTFYLLAAGVALVSLRPYASLWAVASKDLDILQTSLQELAKRWPSSIGASKALQNVMDSAPKEMPSGNAALPQLPWLNATQMHFFEGFPAKDLCRMWEPCNRYVELQAKDQTGDSSGNDAAAHNGGGEINTAEMLGTLCYPHESLLRFGGSAGEADDLLGPFQYEGVGNWLLSDWSAELPR